MCVVHLQVQVAAETLADDQARAGGQAQDAEVVFAEVVITLVVRVDRADPLEAARGFADAHGRRFLPGVLHAGLGGVAPVRLGQELRVQGEQTVGRRAQHGVVRACVDVAVVQQAHAGVDLPLVRLALRDGLLQLHLLDEAEHRQAHVFRGAGIVQHTLRLGTRTLVVQGAVVGHSQLQAGAVQAGVGRQQRFQGVDGAVGLTGFALVEAQAVLRFGGGGIGRALGALCLGRAGAGDQGRDQGATGSAACAGRRKHGIFPP